MFGTYFKSSLKSLPWLVLLPIVMFVLYVLVVDTNFGYDFINADDMWFSSEDAKDGKGVTFMVGSMIVAIVANFILLMIIPPALGGLDTGKKRGQFYLGFFVNIALAFLFPIFALVTYHLNATGFGILIAQHLISFPLAFILGARFVSPAYAKAFWFA